MKAINDRVNSEQVRNRAKINLRTTWNGYIEAQDDKEDRNYSPTEWLSSFHSRDNHPEKYIIEDKKLQLASSESKQSEDQIKK